MTFDLSTIFQNTRGNFAMIPARMHGAVAGGPMWFAQSGWSGGSSADIVRMDNVLTSTPSFKDNNIAVNSYSMPSSVLQPGSTVAPEDCRTQHVEWNNGQLVFSFDSASGSDAAAAWFRVNTSGSSPVLSDQGVIHPASGVSTYFPAVSIDSAGNMGLTYMESSASEYVSMYVTGRRPADAVGAMAAPIRAFPGAIAISSREGDYSGIALDPSATGKFWAANEYAPSGLAWGTGIQAFNLAMPANDTLSFVNQPSISPNPITGGNTATATALASSSAGLGVAYYWACTGPATVGINPNGSASASTTTITFPQNGSYSCAVAAADGTAPNVTSNAVTVVENLSAPTAPTNLTVSQSNKSVMLTWNVSSGATGYYVFQTVNGGTATKIATTASTSYKVNVNSKNSYTFFVEAYNPGGTSAPSNIVSITPSGHNPAGPREPKKG
jgi:hypothetical protein